MDQSIPGTMTVFGRAVDVKIHSAKPAQYPGQRNGDMSLSVTFKIVAPPAPNEPNFPDWKYRQVEDELEQITATESNDEASAADKKKAANRKVVLENQRAELDRQRAELDAKYADEVAQYGPRMKAFAAMIGVTAIYAGRLLRIDLTPHEQMMFDMGDVFAPALPPPLDLEANS